MSEPYLVQRNVGKFGLYYMLSVAVPTLRCCTARPTGWLAVDTRMCALISAIGEVPLVCKDETCFCGDIKQMQ